MDEAKQAGDEERQSGDGEETPRSPKAGPIKWVPNQHYLDVLLGMGISKNAAMKGLYYTNNQGPDFAAAWIFENSDMDLDGPIEELGGSDAEDDDAPHMYKMVFVVNMELEMGTGKIATQVAHAALGLYRALIQDEARFASTLFCWDECGETKIALRADSEQQLFDLELQAIDLDLPTFLVQDAGKTQVPAGSTTVLAIMGKLDVVDRVTGGLRLL